MHIASGLTVAGAAPEPGEIIDEIRISMPELTEKIGYGKIVDCKKIAAFTKAQAMKKLE